MPRGPVANQNTKVGRASVLGDHSSRIASGCLSNNDAWVQWFSKAKNTVASAEPLWVNQVDGLLQGSSMSTDPKACSHYAAVINDQGQAQAMALFDFKAMAEQDREWMSPKISTEKSSALANAGWLKVGSCELGKELEWIPLKEGNPTQVTSEIPENRLRELAILVNLMQRQAKSDGKWVRVVLSNCPKTIATQPSVNQDTSILAVELLDEQGLAMDSAIWMERSGQPSGFVSSSGADYERIIWQSPVSYLLVSRGVGWSNLMVKQKTLTKTKKGAHRVRYTYKRILHQHQGVDFAAPSGTPVYAVADGFVKTAGPMGNYGNLVIIEHGATITTYYAHLSAFEAGITEGAPVQRGQQIGLVGSTGRSTGPHLHFEIRRDGVYLDPANQAHSLPNWVLAESEYDQAMKLFLGLQISRAGSLSISGKPTETPIIRANHLETR